MHEHRMAAIVYSNANYATVARSVLDGHDVPVQYGSPLRSRLPPENSLICGKTYDYYNEIHKSYFSRAGYIAMDTYDRPIYNEGMRIPIDPLTWDNSRANVVEFNGQLYVIVSSYYVQGNYAIYTGDNPEEKGMSRIGSLWYQNSSAELDDGKLYFATYNCTDFAITDMPEWHVLNFSPPGYHSRYAHDNPRICPGTHGGIYNSGLIEDAYKKCLLMRDPRTPDTVYIGARADTITNVDGVLYTIIFDQPGRIEVHLYDERTTTTYNMCVGVDTMQSGVCRFRPKQSAKAD